MTGYISSLQSLGTLDGPGVRAVVFLEGCPLRCIYCHNPETWEMKKESAVTAEELCRRILRLYPYIKDGGVTFSGGEPCVQADFVAECAKILKTHRLHTALDTSGEILNPSVEKMLEYIDLVILDFKAVDADTYRYVSGGGSVENTKRFLEFCQKHSKEVWIRQVVVPGINDTKEAIHALKKLVEPFGCVSKTELLGFKKLCTEKYGAAGIDFPLKDTEEMSAQKLSELQELLQ